jgi:uncharacterized protein (TIGR00661 family)
MRVLYGVVGEGMGHATRSRVVIEHLLARGHHVRVVVSGRAHGFLSRVFAGRPEISFEEIHGFHLNYEGAALDLSQSIWSNLAEAPAGLLKNLGVYNRVLGEGFEPDVVISDFESWAYLYAVNHRLPVISIDNMQVLNRCRHENAVTAHGSLDFWLAKWAVKAKLPGAYHYLITSFFFPPVKKKRTSLIPAILRPEILSARREPGDHVLVYQTAAAAGSDLVPMLQSLPYQFRVYGVGTEQGAKNVVCKPFSETGFVDDLRTARAVIANGGLSLMGEAVHLHVPMLSIPIDGQYEQELNARYLSHLGYGVYSEKLDRAIAAMFLENLPSYQRNVDTYVPRDNTMLFGCVDELLARIADGEAAPARLDSPTLGSWQGAADEEDA